jgi:uncharacterized protein
MVRLNWLPFGTGSNRISKTVKSSARALAKANQAASAGTKRVARQMKSIGEKHGGELVAGACVISGVVAAVSGVGAYLFERAVRQQRRPLTDKQERAARSVAEATGASVATVEIRAEDDAALRAWYFQAATDEHRAVLLLHGRGENRSGMLAYARFLLRNGYSVLCPDLRGHGASAGEFTGYGLKEALDVKLWVDWLKDEQAQTCVFALGRSMGAAILLQALRYRPDLLAVVAESPFTNFREVAYDNVGRTFGVGSWAGRTVLRPVVESGIAYGRLRYGMDLRDVTPDEALRSTNVPILFVHGESDATIPVRHAARLLERCAGTADLWQVPGVGHCRVLARQRQEFERRICAWFQNAPVVPAVG